MTDRLGPPPGDPPSSGDDADRWRDAARLRRDHPRWIIIWLGPLRQFRAYRRLPGARRDTALTAATSADLASLITQAEQTGRVGPAAARTRKESPSK